MTERAGIAVVQDPDEALAPSMAKNAIENATLLPISLAAFTLVPGGGQHYSCPECGGVLEEIEESGMLRFRCRVGHQYSPDSLLEDQGEAVEKALWAAIRNLEEQAEFSERLAPNSRNKKHAPSSPIHRKSRVQPSKR